MSTKFEDGQTVSCWINKKVVIELDKLASEKGITRSAVIGEILEGMVEYVQSRADALNLSIKEILNVIDIIRLINKIEDIE